MVTTFSIPRGLDFDTTFKSGQTFRWSPSGQYSSEWFGVVAGTVLRTGSGGVEVLGSLRELEDTEQFLNTYFSLDDDLPRIQRTFPNHPYLQEAVSDFPGLRILRQDAWECLISFVCSINKNIAAISGCVNSLARRFGRKIPSSYGHFYAFPEAGRLSEATKSELLSCGVGFRWRYIKYIANKVKKAELDLNSIRRLSYYEGQRMLVSELSGKTFGVGPKVSDCALLFSFHKLEAFPLDTWMLRCLREKYPNELGFAGFSRTKRTISSRRYYSMANEARKYFGVYAGYAQQYLYMKIRKDFTRSKGPAGTVKQLLISE